MGQIEKYFHTPVPRRLFLKATLLPPALYLAHRLSQGKVFATDCHLPGQDYPIEGGRFFEQNSPEGKGFAVVDDENALIWSEVQRFGGVYFTGFPISGRFSQEPDSVYQAFQRVILKWLPSEKRVIAFNLLDHASALGLEDKPQNNFMVPKKQNLKIDGSDFESIRLAAEGAFLTNAALTDFYQSFGHERFWIFGLPQSPPVYFEKSKIIAQSFACMALHLTTEGEIFGASIGYFAAENGFIPPQALKPQETNNFKCRETVQKFSAGEVVWRGDRSLPYVYLNFDDAYDANLVRQILDIAREAKVRVNFFPVGSVLQNNRQLWQQVVAEGHAIENHTYSHLALSKLSEDDIRLQIIAQQEAARTALGNPGYRQHFLRPPYGDGIFNYDQRIVKIAADLGLKIAMWSIDSNGWKYKDQQTVLSNVLSNLENGSIILQHTNSADIAALPEIIAQIKSRGLIPLTLADGIA